MTAAHATNQTTDLAAITDEIAKVLNECSVANIRELPALKQALVLAKGMKQLRAALSEPVVNAVFLPLQGTRLGFRTDKDRDGGYPWDVVRDCAIEALIRGFQPVGNEFNIISNNAYFTREGFERVVREFPGMANLEIDAGVPHLSNGGALVPYHARWLLNGQPMQITCDLIKQSDGQVLDLRIPVRINSGMGADAILGKGRRKLLARIYDRICGTKITTPDGDVLDTEGVPVRDEVVRKAEVMSAVDRKTDELVEKHKAKAAARKAEQSPANGATAPADPAADSSGHPEPGANG